MMLSHKRTLIGAIFINLVLHQLSNVSVVVSLRKTDRFDDESEFLTSTLTKQDGERRGESLGSIIKLDTYFSPKKIESISAKFSLFSPVGQVRDVPFNPNSGYCSVMDLESEMVTKSLQLLIK